MVSSKGKYHNLGWDRSEAPATIRQRWALFFVSNKKQNYLNSSKVLSEQRADELIKEYNNKRRDVTLNPSSAVSDAYFLAAMDKAILAANKAGDAWEEEHLTPSYYIYHEDTCFEEPVFGAIGDVYIRWPNRRSKFGIFLRNYFFDNQYERVNIPHNYISRREYELLFLCETAALDALVKYNVLGLKIVSRKT